ncbi:MAG: dockerin type I domain-containing protein, partial [Phycisphaerae bacterium]
MRMKTVGGGRGRDNGNRNFPRGGRGCEPLEARILLDALHVVSWASEQIHARGVGAMYLPIASDGTFTEPRSGGIQTLVATFDAALDPTWFVPALVRVAGTDANGNALDLSSLGMHLSTRSGNFQGVINFDTALPNAAKYVVQLTGALSATGAVLSGNTNCAFTALRGDVSGDGRVNATDLSFVSACINKTIGAADISSIRADVNQDGRVNSTDLTWAWAGRGSDLRFVATPVIPSTATSAAVTYQTLVGAPPLATTLAWQTWYQTLLADRLAAVPSARARTYYFSQTGNDVTGDGTAARPYRSLTLAQALLDQAIGDLRLRFRRGDVWTEGRGLSIAFQQNVTVDDYADLGGENLPIPRFTMFSVQYPDTTGWQSAGNGVYSRAEPTAIGWVRLTATPLDNIMVECGSVADVAALPYAFWYDSVAGRLYVKVNGTDLTTNGVPLEAAPINTVMGLYAAGNNIRLQNIEVDGFNVGNLTSLGYGIKVVNGAGEQAVVVGCQDYYGGYHNMG